MPDRTPGLRADRGVRGRARGSGRRPPEDGLLSGLDTGADERRREVRPRLLSRLHLIEDTVAGDPALDIAVSRALLLRVAAGELPETLRLSRPEAMVAFGKQDAVAEGFSRA